jgi:hypothetical protein
MKGKECAYVQPSKRGPKRKKDYNSTFSVDVPIEAKKVEHRHTEMEPDVITALRNRELYIDLNQSITPLVPKDRLGFIFDYIFTLHSSPNPTFIQNPPHYEEIALGYAMFGYTLKMFGFKTTARCLIEKSVEIFSTSVSNGATSFITAATYLYCSLYWESDDNRDKMIYYMQQVGSYLSLVALHVPLDNENVITPQIVQCRILQHMFLFSKSRLENSTSVTQVLKMYLRGYYLYGLLNRIHRQTFVDETVENLVRKIKEDLQSGKNGSPLQLEVMEAISHDIRKTLETGSPMNLQVQSTQLLFQMFMNAFRIEQLQQRGMFYEPALLESADNIAKSCMALVNCFAPPIAAIPLAKAVTVHLQSLDTFNRERVNTKAVMENLGEELSGFTILAKKHLRVANIYNGVISNLRNIIWKYNQNLESSYDYTQSPYIFENTVQHYNEQHFLADALSERPHDSYVSGFLVPNDRRSTQ